MCTRMRVCVGMHVRVWPACVCAVHLTRAAYFCPHSKSPEWSCKTQTHARTHTHTHTKSHHTHLLSFPRDVPAGQLTACSTHFSHPLRRYCAGRRIQVFARTVTTANVGNTKPSGFARGCRFYRATADVFFLLSLGRRSGK